MLKLQFTAHPVLQYISAYLEVWDNTQKATKMSHHQIVSILVLVH